MMRARTRIVTIAEHLGERFDLAANVSALKRAHARDAEVRAMLQTEAAADLVEALERALLGGAPLEISTPSLDEGLAEPLTPEPDADADELDAADETDGDGGDEAVSAEANANARVETNAPARERKPRAKKSKNKKAGK